MKSDVLDDLDRQLLHALQIDGRAPFSRIAAVLGVSDHTIARRFRMLRDTANLRVMGLVDESQLGGQTWVVRLSCAPDFAETVTRTLARRPDTSYVSLISGGSEVLCIMQPRSLRERDDVLLDRLQRTPKVVAVRAHCVLHTFRGGPFGWPTMTNSLTPDQESALRRPVSAPDGGPVVLDPIDRALLAVLQSNGRATHAELQAASGQSESSVRRRLDVLRSSRILYFDIQYEPASVGHATQAIFWLSVAPATVGDVGRALASLPESAFVASTTGQANLVASTLVPTVGDLHTYFYDKIGTLPGVHALESSLILRQVKHLAYVP